MTAVTAAAAVNDEVEPIHEGSGTVTAHDDDTLPLPVEQNERDSGIMVNLHSYTSYLLN